MYFQEKLFKHKTRTRVNNEKNGLSYVYEGSDYFYGEMRNDRADGLGVLVTGNNYKQGLVFEGNLVEELEFCKKLFFFYHEVL